MAQQLEAPKLLLARQASFPKLALQGTPVAPLGEGLSGVLTTLANALPDVPSPPGGAGVIPTPGAPGAAGLPRFSSLFKSLEANLPDGLPRLSQVTQSLEGGGQNAQAGPIMQGGFRSVAGADKRVKVLSGGYRSI